MKTARLLVAFTAVAVAVCGRPLDAQTALDDAQQLFYNGQYEAADPLTVALCSNDLAGLAGCELRSSTLLFQIKRAVPAQGDRQKALKLCARCADWIAQFRTVTVSAQAIARARLQAAPEDEGARFLLGKIDLNYVWLQLGVLGHKTGWGEYWEARKSLDAVLKQNPHNVRARVARAWIDYIVDTQMPRGTRWVLGGGNKKRGLTAVREAADVEGDRFIRAEAGFALWDMQVREGNVASAVETARGLARDFPDNGELRKFLAAHESRVSD
jgi:tetratricopeptide (TPR) repeat protein